MTIVANWFGHGKKGLIMGIWNSHTSIGNILGSLLAGAYVDINWGLSFIVPGFIITTVGAFFWFTLVTKPEDVGLSLDAATVMHFYLKVLSISSVFLNVLFEFRHIASSRRLLLVDIREVVAEEETQYLQKMLPY